MLEAPLYQQANSYPARLDRQFIEDVFDVEGVIKPASGALLVSPRAAGANMSVDIAAGRAVIKGDDEANQGSYRVISTAVENRALGAAPGSNSRIDLVVAQVRDANVTGGVTSDWDIIVIPGEVAAAPVSPAVPTTAIPLAEILVAAGTLSIDAAKITDRRPSASNAAYQARALIAQTVLGASAGSIIFNPIPGTFEDIWVELTGSASAVAQVLVRLNGDTGAVFDYQRIVGSGTAASSDGAAAQTTINVGAFGGPAPAGGAVRIDLPAYARTVHRKMLRAFLTRSDGDAAPIVQQTAARYRSTNAITSVELIASGGTFNTGTVATLYGTKV